MMQKRVTAVRPMYNATRLSRFPPCGLSGEEAGDILFSIDIGVIHLLRCVIRRRDVSRVRDVNNRDLLGVSAHANLQNAL